MNSPAQSGPCDARDRLGTLAKIAIVAGGITAGGLFLYAGRNRHPGAVVVIGFTAWVVSPFVVLALGEFLSKRWANRTQRALHVIALVLTLATLAIYGVLAFGPPRGKMVPIFVLVPPISWMSIAVVMVTAALAARGNGAGPQR